MTEPVEVGAELAAWFRSQMPDVTDLRIEGQHRVEFGHSAEMMMLTLVSGSDTGETRREVVVRIRPPAPGLLEPYDMARQFEILRALEPTPVLAPKALWLEPSGEVIGRSFYVMERVAGEVYETAVPEEFDAQSGLIRQMCESFVDQLAEIHLVDLETTGLRRVLGDGRDYLDRELDHWAREMRRVQRGPLPALERLHDELCAQQPEPSPHVTLVHGDAKPGNVAFVGAEVSAVFDWEMTAVGDPLADIGYAEMMWSLPVGLPTRPGALTADEIVARYETSTGIEVLHRPWYRAFQMFKVLVIQLIGSMLFDRGISDDLRLAEMGMGIPYMTPMGLRDLGVDEEPESGPVVPSSDRIAAVRAAARAARPR